MGRRKPPLFVRPLTDPERQALRDGLRSKGAFTLRRCQVLTAGAEGLRPARIAARFGCGSQAARNAIPAFDAPGDACLREGSHRPASARPAIDDAGCERPRAPLHRSPRDLGKPTALWTLALAAEVAHAEGITDRLVSGETIRRALSRLGRGWKRAKTWITGPDPASLRTRGRDRLIRPAAPHPDGVLGYQDEVRGSRRARPGRHAWADGEPMRLREPAADGAGAGPKALACYGILRADTGGMSLRFGEGRPVSQATEEFLAWACRRLAKEGERALLLVRDSASRHARGRVRARIKGPNRRAKAEGGVRLVACSLPAKAPWLDAIEPKWVHGKRAIVEPDRPLTADEVVARVCGYYGCERLDPIAQHVA